LEGHFGSHISDILQGLRGRKSNPTRTRSVSAKVPIILRTGSGSLLTRVGMARIWSPFASLGFSSRSITSIEYLPFKCSSHILFILV